jgi:hypothetical protein
MWVSASTSIDMSCSGQLPTPTPTPTNPSLAPLIRHVFAELLHRDPTIWDGRVAGNGLAYYWGLPLTRRGWGRVRYNLTHADGGC